MVASLSSNTCVDVRYKPVHVSLFLTTLSHRRSVVGCTGCIIKFMVGCLYVVTYLLVVHVSSLCTGLVVRYVSEFMSGC